MRATRFLSILLVSLLAASCKQPPPPPPVHSDIEDLLTVALKVSSDPAGASIWLDGADSGKKTPATLTLNSGKDYLVEVRHPDFLPASEKVFSAPGKPIALVLPLKAGARITVTSDPAGARIEVDGKDSFAAPGKTDPLPPGKHLLVARAPGMSFEGKEFGTTAAEALDWNVKLEPAATVPVHSTPSGAAILVDGRPVGLVTPADVAIPLGKRHTVKLLLKGFSPALHKLPELTAKAAPKPVELMLEASTTADLKARLAVADKAVRALEARLKKLKAKQSGFMVADPRKELALEKQVDEAESALEQAQIERDGVREELQKAFDQ